MSYPGDDGTRRNDDTAGEARQTTDDAKVTRRSVSPSEQARRVEWGKRHAPMVQETMRRLREGDE